MRRASLAEFTPSATLFRAQAVHAPSLAAFERRAAPGANPPSLASSTSPPRSPTTRYYPTCAPLSHLPSFLQLPFFLHRCDPCCSTCAPRSSFWPPYLYSPTPSQARACIRGATGEKTSNASMAAARSLLQHCVKRKQDCKMCVEQHCAACDNVMHHAWYSRLFASHARSHAPRFPFSPSLLPAAYQSFAACCALTNRKHRGVGRAAA